MNLGKRGESGKMFGKIDKCLLKFATEQAADSPIAKTFRAKRSVQTVGAKMRSGIYLADGHDEFQGQTRGRVHRHVKRNELRLANGLLVQRLARKVQAGDRVTALAQPRRR